MSYKGLQKINPQEILFNMGGFGVLLFAPAYSMLQKGIIDYKTLLLFEGSFFAAPHLMSTYFRTYTEKAELERYKAYTIYLPVLLVLGIALFIHYFGVNFLWVLGSIYFYWQWWHHARQSFGLGRKYQRSNEYEISDSDKRVNDLAIWAVAILGIVLKSNAAGDHYETIPIKAIHLPLFVTYSLIALAGVYIFFFIGRQLYLASSKQTIQAQFLTHWLIQSFVFICFFGLLPTDIGIIAASFWHCTQYISYVHEHQEKKVSNNILQHPFFQNLFSRDNWLVYLGVLITVSFVLPALRLGFQALQLNSLALAFSIAVTFHHYILDGVIWTRNEINWSLNSKRSAVPIADELTVVQS